MQALRSTVDVLRDRLAPISHTSTFRQTGQITPDEFLQAGDYLVYKFPSWSWASASTPARRVTYLPADKQYLVTRGVPCHRRLDANFAGEGEERVIQGEDGDAEGWLSTGGSSNDVGRSTVGDVRSLGDRGEVEPREDDEEEIPDMEDDEDDAEAIIPDGGGAGASKTPLRTYNLYITYTPYYRTPRLYLSGYVRSSAGASAVPLAPAQMLEDIVGDYKDKTVTLEDFPFFDTPVKTASVHPCKHASVMKVLLDRADAAVRLRREKRRDERRAAAGRGAPATTTTTASGARGAPDPASAGMDTLVSMTSNVAIGGGAEAASTENAAGAGAAGLAAGAKAGGQAAPGDEWEVLQAEDEGSDDAADGTGESAIRVDQYVVVFLKFMASVTPGIEHDFTMGV